MNNDMPQPIPEMLQHWKQLLGLREMLQEPDAVLIRRFREEKNDLAFAALLSRHGPMVKSVCRRVLRNSHDVEDVVQATFLAFAKHARSTQQEYDAVAAWLHRAARNLSINLYHQKRRRGSIGEPTPITPDPTEEISQRETLQLLDEELQRLPEKFRSALILCFLEGLSQEEAARHLNCARRTVCFRVDRGRALLQRRLLRRGVVVGAVVLIASSKTAAEAASFALRTGCFKATVRAATQMAQGQPIVGVAAKVLALSGRAGSTTFPLNKLGIGVLLAVLLTTAAGLAATAWPHVARAPVPEEADPNARGEEATQTVSGRILDADGKPTPKAAVAVLADWEVLVQGHTDEKGQFQFDIPETAQLERRGCRRVVIVARADKHGINWRSFPRDATFTDCSIKLPREQTLLLDVGQVHAGARIELAGLAETTATRNDFRCADSRLDNPGNLDLWPEAAKVNSGGFVALTGLSADRDLFLVVRRVGRADESIFLDSERAGAGFVRLNLNPKPRQVSGRVVADDSGKPIPATVMLLDEKIGRYWHRPAATTRADSEGKFRFENATGGDAVAILAPGGEPYLPQYYSLTTQIENDIRITLKRGVNLRGKVVDTGDRPVAGAEVRLLPDPKNRRAADLTLFRAAAVATDVEGRFVLPVAPGSGHLLVHAVQETYRLDEPRLLAVSIDQLDRWRPTCAHAIRDLEVPKDGLKDELCVTLKSGPRPSVDFVRPSGEAGDAYVFSWQHPDSGECGVFKTAWAAAGHYQLTGCDPEQVYPTVIWDAQARLGAVVNVPGNADLKRPMKATLSPCGSVTVQFRDRWPLRMRWEDGVLKEAAKPADLRDRRPPPKLPGRLFLQMLIEPPFRAGEKRLQRSAMECGITLFAEATNPSGMVRFSSLVPGARYRMLYLPPRGEPEVIQEFRVKPGEEWQIHFKLS
jgi:RNA polymerase sigma factor (sigma-70 family)